MVAPKALPTLSPRGFVLLCVLGLLAAALFALVPVSVHFGDDPLLRLRRLDPQLSSPGATADCGSPVSSLSVEPASIDLYDVARAAACENAARRRVSVGLAIAAICVIVGLLGVYASSPLRGAQR